MSLGKIIPDIWIGTGNSSFSMSRGSFTIKDHLLKFEKLESVLSEPNKSRENEFKNFQVTYKDSTGRIVGSLYVNQSMDEACLQFKEKDETHTNRYRFTFPCEKEDRIYGCGEHFTRFDLRGERVRIWVAEHQSAKRISKKVIREAIWGKKPEKKLQFSKYESYYVQPTFVIAGEEKRYVHVDGTSYMEFDFRSEHTFSLNLHQNACIYIGTAPTFPELSMRLAKRLGHQRKLPDWCCEGAVLGMQGGSKVIEEKLELAKRHNVKIAGIWCQDWEGARITKFGYQLMWNWKWDETLYPGLDRLIIKWKKEGIRFLGYINPFLAIEKELYQYAHQNGYCVKNKKGEDYQVTITTFPAAMIDFTNPNAYKWIKDIIKKNMIGFGLSGWMADFGEYLPTDCVLYSGEDPKLIHNQWPAIWARINREAIKECKCEEDVCFFTRAGFTESIRYSTMMWNGDQHVDWSIDDGLPSVIPATLSLAMSGFGITHSDVGGYTTIYTIRREEELLKRWTELCAFSPFMRTHEGNQPEHNIQYDSNTGMLDHFARMSQVHSILKDYIKDCMKSLELGIPMIRPLFYHYEEPKAFSEAYEYLLGRDILVAPVLKANAKTREVYLPKDQWVHLFTGQSYSGGLYMIDAPYGEPPVFIRFESLWCEQLLHACKGFHPIS